MSKADLKDLIASAVDARTRAHAPFSKFRVGAAVETTGGKVYQGCNIESSSFGLTVCAERVAIWKAISEGAKCAGRIVVVADTEDLTPPCGTCRQIIWEFCHETTVILTNLQGKQEVIPIRELLPRAFDAKYLKEVGGAETDLDAAESAP